MLAAVIINTIRCVLGMLRHEEYMEKTDMVFAFVNTAIIWEDRGCVGY